MKEVAKHHRILNFPNARGKEEQWLAIDCAFIESGILYAKKNGCKRVLFGVMDDKKAANDVKIDVLQRLEGLEGVIWHIPISKGADLSALKAHVGMKYLSIIQPNLIIDLGAFPELEYLGFFFSETITGYDKASKLRYVSVSGLSADLGFLGAVKNLIKLDIVRSDIESLAGIEKSAKLEELSLIRCGKLADVSHAASLRRLQTFSIENSSELTDLSVLRKFNSLKTLWLKLKKIESCTFIPIMKSIEFASINAEIMDNDLSPFLTSETLEEVWFSPMKRTYSPKLSPDEINEMLIARKSRR